MQSQQRLRLDPAIATPGSTESRVLIAFLIVIYWTYAALGRDVFYNRLADPTAEDPIGAILNYVRFALASAAIFYILMRVGFDWMFSRVPVIFAPFAIYAVLSSFWADNFKGPLQNGMCLVALWIAVSLLVHRIGAVGAVLASLYLIAFVVILSTFLALLVPKIGVHTGEEVLQAVHKGRWRGIFAHKNSLGPWAALGSVFFFTHLRMIPKPNMLFWWFARICALACLFLSGDATALVVTATMWVAWICLLALRRMRGFTLLGLIITAIAFGVGLFALFGDAFFALIGRDSSLTGRSSIWDFAMSYIWDECFTFGKGFAQLGGSEFAERTKAVFEQEIPGAESGYLTLWLDMGIVGFVLFFIPYLMSVKNGFEWVRYLRGRERGAIEFFLMSILGTFVHGYSESSAFIASGYDGPICFGALFFLLSLPRSPASIAREQGITAERYFRSLSSLNRPTAGTPPRRKSPGSPKPRLVSFNKGPLGSQG
jgi:O-antigen ligase